MEFDAVYQRITKIKAATFHLQAHQDQLDLQLTEAK